MSEKKEMLLKTEEDADSTVKDMVKDGADDKENPIVKFKKPYLFEKKEYTEVDLSGMEELTGSDMIDINKMMARSNSGGGSMPEVTMEYACYFAARAAGLPVEFFLGLHPREAMKVKSRVVSFLFGSD